MCRCNGPPGKTCLGVLYENAKAANTTFLGTGMGGPCAVMLVGIVSAPCTRCMLRPAMTHTVFAFVLLPAIMLCDVQGELGAVT
jgi:hypothetical protein